MSDESLPRKVGRPSLCDEQTRDKIIELCESGKTNKQIAEVIGVHEITIERWIKKYVEFGWAVRLAKQQADELVEAALFTRATGYSHPETKFFQADGVILTEETIKHYPPDTEAGKFWLKNRQPDKWRDKMPGEEPQVHVHNNLSTDKSTEELELRYQQLKQKIKTELMSEIKEAPTQKDPNE